MKLPLLFFTCAALALAHIGSPDIYLEGQAGPYQLFVTVRPPVVIPGVAELEVRSETPGIREIRAVPMPMSGAGAKFAPLPDQLKKSPQDAQFFTGSLWMMAPGSWQVRLTADGDHGTGVVAVPVPSAALKTKSMQTGLGIVLSFLGIFLVTGMVAIVGASVRESKLEPGVVPGANERRRARVAMVIAAAVLFAILYLGASWWNSEASSYGDKVYKPLQMAASLNPAGILTLHLTDPGWLQPPPRLVGRILPVRTVDDLVLDHDHLMHLYAIRQPGLDVVFHLHPDQKGRGLFELPLPDMPPGTYKLYADIVHKNGFPETLVSTLVLPQGEKGRALVGDDAKGVAPSWQQTSPSNAFTLPDGYRMEWIRSDANLKARQAMMFRFRLLDPTGHAPQDMQLYMGMLGHAAFIKTDGTVFAHIHPTGSVAMTAYMLAQDQAKPQSQTQQKTPSPSMPMKDMDMSGMSMKDMGPMDHSAESPDAMLPDEVGFPYGFPSAGRYRIFVQMKHGATVETGAFDANVQ